MKPDTVFKRAFNRALDVIAKLDEGDPLPSENMLAAELKVSRSTARKVILDFAARGLVAGNGRHRAVHAPAGRVAPFPEAETVPLSEVVEQRFMEWMLRDDTRPGTAISEIELARQFGVAPASIRDFLNRFQRFGLIEKRPNAGWLFKGFITSFALELFEIRELCELLSAKTFGTLPETSPLWRQIEALRREHVALLGDVGRRYHDFSELDSRFHRLINTASPNRFIDSFYDVISLIFHYHYQWNKRDEQQRNEVAIREHLTYIDALRGRNPATIEAACRAHLASAKVTLIRSTSPAAR